VGGSSTAAARGGRRRPMSPGPSRAGRRALSSTCPGTSSTRFGSPGWTGAAPRPPRRRSTRAKCGPSPAGNNCAVDPGTRRELTRYGAPAAFLAAVTIAVLLIKSGLDNSEATTTAVATTTTARTTTQQTTTKLVLTNPGTT